jgi:hypothetical protein
MMKMSHMMCVDEGTIHRHDFHIRTSLHFPKALIANHSAGATGLDIGDAALSYPGRDCF